MDFMKTTDASSAGMTDIFCEFLLISYRKKKRNGMMSFLVLWHFVLPLLLFVCRAVECCKLKITLGFERSFCHTWTKGGRNDGIRLGRCRHECLNDGTYYPLLLVSPLNIVNLCSEIVCWLYKRTEKENSSNYTNTNYYTPEMFIMDDQ